MSSENEIPKAVAAEMLLAEQDRRRDAGHFNQYGMRDDAPVAPATDHANPGDGSSARHFGAGGDDASYENRPAPDDHRPHGPILAVDSSGSSRGLGLDHGDETHQEPRLSSRQGSRLINELARDHWYADETGKRR